MLIYQYYFDSEEKVFLYEVYKSNVAAIEHVKNFRGSKWESKFGELFSIENFAVLGEASKDLKKSLEGYTTDFRYLKGGFHKPAKKLSKEIISSEHSVKLLGGDLFFYMTPTKYSSIIGWKKIYSTPEKYPRKPGTPQKHPLSLK